MPAGLRRVIFRKATDETMIYDVIIIGAGPGGIFSAYELMGPDWAFIR